MHYPYHPFLPAKKEGTVLAAFKQSTEVRNSSRSSARQQLQSDYSDLKIISHIAAESRPGRVSVFLPLSEILTLGPPCTLGRQPSASSLAHRLHTWYLHNRDMKQREIRSLTVSQADQAHSLCSNFKPSLITRLEAAQCACKQVHSDFQKTSDTALPSQE